MPAPDPAIQPVQSAQFVESLTHRLEAQPAGAAQRKIESIGAADAVVRSHIYKPAHFAYQVFDFCVFAILRKAFPRG